MNSRSSLTLLAVSLSTLSASQVAVIVSDDFSGTALNATNWDTGSTNINDGGAFDSVDDGLLGYTTGGSATGLQPRINVTSTTTLAQSSDWTMSVTISLADLADLGTFGAGDGVAMTVQISNINDNTDRLEVNFAAINFGSPGYAVRFAERLDDTNGNEPIIPIAGTTATSATILVSYNSTTQLATAAYSIDGGALNGFGFEADLSGWTTGAGDMFSYKVEGSAGNFATSGGVVGDLDVTTGEAGFDSFTLEDTATALPVPEPSVTLIGGLSALLLFRRRRS